MDLLYIISNTKIGDGGEGVVMSGNRKSDNRAIAMKIVEKAKYKLVDGIPVEVCALKRLKSCEGVVQLLDWYVSPYSGRLTIVMDRVTGSDLYHYITRRGRLTEAESREIINQTVHILRSMRERGVEHGDLKDENLIWNPITRHLTIIDFGCSYESHVDHRAQNGKVGTQFYKPPEQTEKKAKGDATTQDCALVWTIGLLLYTMLFGDVPPNLPRGVRPTDIDKRVKRSAERGCYISANCVQFLKNCLEYDPHLRHSLVDLVASPWLLGGAHKNDDNKN